MAGLVPATHVLQTQLHARRLGLYPQNKPNGILYTGVTRDIARRAWQHREGMTPGFTRRYGVKRLVWCEHHDAIAGAIQREKTMKHWPRAWKVRLILAMNPEWDDLYDSLNR